MKLFPRQWSSDVTGAAALLARLLARRPTPARPALRRSLKAGLLENACVKSDLVFKYLIFHFGFLITKEASRSPRSCQFLKHRYRLSLIRHRADCLWATFKSGI